MTPQMQAALSFIKAYMFENQGVSPNYEEIRQGIGIGSKGGVNRILKSLAERGLISFVPHRARSIQVVEGPSAEVMSRWSDDELRLVVGRAQAILAARQIGKPRAAA